MRWSLAVLILVGIIGAICAAVLVGGYRASGRSAPTTEVTVLVAAKPLEGMTIIRAEDVTTRKMPSSEAPKDAYSDPGSVVGKVLASAMVDQQVFTHSSIAVEGSGMRLATALRPGERAVTIELKEISSNESLIYPGCRVNVIMSMKPAGSDSDPISATLFSGVQVLAVGAKTVMTEDDSKKTDGSAGSRRMTVTLLVDDKQAQVLALAARQGTIMLTMRGPLDETKTTQQPTLLSDLARDYGIPLAAALTKTTVEPIEVSTAPSASAPAASVAAVPVATPPPSRRQWEIQVIRGSTSEVKKFVLTGPASETPEEKSGT